MLTEKQLIQLAIANQSLFNPQFDFSRPLKRQTRSLSGQHSGITRNFKAQIYPFRFNQSKTTHQNDKIKQNQQQNTKFKNITPQLDYDWIRSPNQLRQKRSSQRKRNRIFGDDRIYQYRTIQPTNQRNTVDESHGKQSNVQKRGTFPLNKDQIRLGEKLLKETNQICGGESIACDQDILSPAELAGLVSNIRRNSMSSKNAHGYPRNRYLHSQMKC